MKNLILVCLFFFVSGITLAQSISGAIKTVTIGKQVWMLENLNVSTFKNGVAITELQDSDAWEKAGENKQPAWCYYNNDIKNGAKYGKLYNWYAVIDSNGLCPQGWHVPGDDEWMVLTDYLGGESVAGGKMKDAGTISWGISNTDATNSSLFSALPGGSRDYDASCSGVGYYGYWWSSTEYKTDGAWAHFLYDNVCFAYRANGSKRLGLSVRCLRD
jgi:uncharacterized protein (TIGR02145 family)